MKVKNWIAVALAVAIAGSGTGFLAQAMTQRQEEVMAKTTKVSEKETSPAKEEKKEEEKASYPVQTIAPENEAKIKKTKADMSAEEAAEAAVRKVRDVFGEIDVKKVADVYLTEYCVNKYDVKADTGKEPHNVRVYIGKILCKGNVGFTFCINSITGEKVYWMQKIQNGLEKGYGNPKHEDKMHELIEKNEQKYYRAAKDIAMKHLLQKGKSEEMVGVEVQTGGTAGSLHDMEWQRIVAVVTFTASDEEYTFMVDPKSVEVIGWSMQLK